MAAGRFLGADDFGRFSFALAFMFLFDPLLDPGLYHLLMREVAREKKAASVTLAHALTWKLAASPVVFGAMVLIANILHDSPRTLEAVYIIALSGVLKSMKDACRGVLLGREFFGLDCLSLFVERGGLLAAGLVVLNLGLGLFGLCWTFVAVRLVDLGVALWLVNRHAGPVYIGRDPVFLRRMLGGSLAIAGFCITFSLNSYLDTVILSVLRSPTDVGWYNAAYRIYEGLFMLSAIIATVMMPQISRSYLGAPAVFERLVGRGAFLLSLAGGLIAVNAPFAAGLVIRGFFGAGYVESIPALGLLLFGLPFVFMLNFLRVALIGVNRQRWVFQSGLLMVALTLGLNLALIPALGLLGAALATAASALATLAIVIGYIGWPMEKPALARRLARCAVPPLAGGLAAWALFDRLPAPAAVVAANAVYLALILAFRTLDFSELAGLMRSLGFSRSGRDGESPPIITEMRQR